MSKFKYTEAEQQFNNVLNHQSKELSSIRRPDMTSVEACISESEALLKEVGISTDKLPIVVNHEPKKSWWFLLGKNYVFRQRRKLVQQLI